MVTEDQIPKSVIKGKLRLSYDNHLSSTISYILQYGKILGQLDVYLVEGCVEDFIVKLYREYEGKKRIQGVVGEWKPDEKSSFQKDLSNALIDINETVNSFTYEGPQNKSLTDIM